MNTPAESLARLAIQTLDAQQVYFRTRSPAALDDSKSLERQLRAAAPRLLGDDLAKLAIQTLDAQQVYFRGGRSRDALTQCRSLERQLRRQANWVLHPEHVQPSLFGD